MKKFPMYEKFFVVDEGKINYNKIVLEFKKRKNIASKEFLEFYKKNYKDIEDVSRDALRLGNEIIIKNVEYCIKYIIDLGVYDIDEKFFFENFFLNKNYTFDEYYYKINDKYMEIVLDSSQKEEYRKLRKQNRGKWIGGGFGIKNAFEGAATAGMINLATGFAYDVINISGDIISGIEEENKKNKLFEEESTLRTLLKGIEENVFNLGYSLIEFLYEFNVKEMFIIRKDDKEKVKRILNNINKYNLDFSRKIELLEECLYINPYDEDIYFLFLKILGDPNNELEDIANFFDVDILKLKRKIISNINKENNSDSEESLKKLQKELITCAERMGMKPFSSLRILEVNEKLMKIDIEKKTVDGKIFESREEAEFARVESEKIQEIVKNTDWDDENDLINTKKRILKSNFKYGLENEYLIKIENRLETIDKEKRTFNGVVYSSETEVELHKREFYYLSKIYEKENIFTLESIKKCIEMIESESLKTDEKERFLEKLNEDKKSILEKRKNYLNQFEPLIHEMIEENLIEIDKLEEKIKQLNIAEDIKEYLIEKIRIKEGIN